MEFEAIHLLIAVCVLFVQLAVFAAGWGRVTQKVEMLSSEVEQLRKQFSNGINRRMTNVEHALEMLQNDHNRIHGDDHR